MKVLNQEEENSLYVSSHCIYRFLLIVLFITMQNQHNALQK
jgi:hypothetical protein